MKHAVNDLVVFVPGVMGSELRNRDGDAVWSTSMASLVKGVLTRGRAIKRLQLPDGIGDESAPDGVVATALLPDIHVIPGIWSVSIGYDRAVAWFRQNFDLVEAGGGGVLEPGAPVPNFVPFPYDWRLSNRASARALKARVEPLLERFRQQPGHAEAKVVFIAHSMGGLVVRYYTDVLGGDEITRKVITLGTPHRGAPNALEALVNGVSKGFGPLRIDLSAFARSLPSMYQLLPEYACIESPDGLLKTTEVDLPDIGVAAVADGMRFHDELRESVVRASPCFDVHPILARTQPTATTASLAAGRVTTLRTFQGRDDGGDGTVPRLSAVPYGVRGDDPSVRFVKEKHGALPANEPVLVELEGVLTATRVVAREVIDIGVVCDDIVFAGSPVEVTVEAPSDLVVDITLHRWDGATEAATIATDRGGDNYAARFDDVGPGRYVMNAAVRGTGGGGINSPFVVIPQPTVDSIGSASTLGATKDRW